MDNRIDIKEQNIPMTNGLRKKIIRDQGRKIRMVGVVDHDGNTVVPVEFEDVNLADAARQRFVVSRMMKGGTTAMDCLYGVYDSTGRMIVDTAYRDLYCMHNGWYLVLDNKGSWWVLNEEDQVMFGPDKEGVDIYCDTRKFLYPIRYNTKYGVELLGIYDVSMRTETCKALFTSIRSLGGGLFEVEYPAVTRQKRAVVDEFGSSMKNEIKED